MAYRKHLSIARAVVRDFWVVDPVHGRKPEPNAVMSDAENTDAYLDAAAEQKVMAPIYLFHSAQTLDLIQPGDTVVDLGCGPGVMLAKLAQLHPSANFVGFDLSESMLDNARQHIREAGIGNITLQQADMSELTSLSDRSVDVVFSSMALHHLPTHEHLHKTFAHVERVLKRDGGLYLADLSRLRSAAAIKHLAYQYADFQPNSFTEDYYNSLLAAYSRDEYQRALGPVAGRARIHIMWPTPFMVVVRSKPRCVASAGAQRRFAAIADALPARHHLDYITIRSMFRLGGLKTPRRSSAPKEALADASIE